MHRIAFGLLALFLILVPSAAGNSVATAAVEELSIEFGETPTFTWPFDHNLWHRFRVTNTSRQRQEIVFKIFIRETQQDIVGWPQPQTLYLEPGQTEEVTTMLDDIWGKVKPITADGQRTVEFTFSERKPGGKAITKVVTYQLKYIGENATFSDASFSGTVRAADGSPIANAKVVLANGACCWSTEVYSGEDGTFVVTGPRREGLGISVTATGWSFGFQLVPAGGAEGLELILEPQQETATFNVRKKIDTDIGFWRGVASADGKQFLLVQGQENWKEDSKRKDSALMLFSEDGTLQWQYPMGWEAWGGDLTPDGRFAAYVTDDPRSFAYQGSGPPPTLGVLDARTGTLLWKKEVGSFTGKPAGQAEAAKEVALSPKGTYVALGTLQSDLLVLDRASGQLKWRAFLQGQVRRIVFSDDERTLLAGAGDGGLWKFDVASGAKIWRAPIGAWPYTRGVSMTSDGRIATGSKAGDAVVTNADGSTAWRFQMGFNVPVVSWSPDGQALFAGGSSREGSALFDATGRELWRTTYAQSAAWSADSRYLLMGGGVGLYDRRGTRLGEYMLRGNTTFLWMAPDATRAVAASEDGGVVFLDVEVGAYDPSAGPGEPRPVGPQGPGQPQGPQQGPPPVPQSGESGEWECPAGVRPPPPGVEPPPDCWRVGD